MSLCGLRNLFGEPRKGLHAKRIPLLDIAFWDTAATVLAALYLSENVNEHGIILNLALLWFSGHILHTMFCVKKKPSREDPEPRHGSTPWMHWW